MPAEISGRISLEVYVRTAAALSIIKPASASTSRCALASSMVLQTYPASSAASKNTAPSAALIRNSKLMVPSAFVMPCRILTSLHSLHALSRNLWYSAWATLQIVAGRLDVRVYQRPRFPGFSGTPGLQERRVLARGAFGAPFGTQVCLHVAL